MDITVTTTSAKHGCSAGCERCVVLNGVPLLEYPLRCDYQPIFDVESKVPVAFEALLRCGPDYDPIPPEPLFAAAVADGWVEWLDNQARVVAMNGASGWLGDRDLFVNLMPSSTVNPERCADLVVTAAVSAGLDPSRIVVELVETEPFDTGTVERVVRAFRRAGCRFALDDVGSGYATAEQVVMVGPDVVKLAREVVHGLVDGSAWRAAERIIAAARQVGAVLLAEGVETLEQFEVVERLGVSWVQGFWFGIPDRGLPSPGG